MSSVTFLVIFFYNGSLLTIIQDMRKPPTDYRSSRVRITVTVILDK